jgi:hypothetical protein
LRARFVEEHKRQQQASSNFLNNPAVPAGFFVALRRRPWSHAMPTHFISEADIHRIGCGLIERSLPKREWTHAAHFAAALWLLRYRTGWDASRRMPDLIRAYNEATGVANTPTNGYHETITQASLRAGRAMLARYGSEVPVYIVANALMASPLGRSDWLLAYWSKNRLFSAEARREWVDPDLQAFPY